MLLQLQLCWYIALEEYDGAKVSGQVTSHISGFPRFQGTCTIVTPLGLIPSERRRPEGASLDWMEPCRHQGLIEFVEGSMSVVTTLAFRAA